MHCTAASYRCPTVTGGIEAGALTLQPCIEYVDEWVTLNEEEIGRAVVGVLQHHSKLIEGEERIGTPQKVGRACASGIL